MSTIEAEHENKSQWPAVDAAYAFVVPSYQMMLSRYEAADTRLNALTTVAAGLAGFAPALGKAMNASSAFEGWFVAGSVLLVAAVVAGLWARTMGGVGLPNPRVIFDKHLHESDWEFRKNAIDYAGQAFELNAAIIRRKGNWSVAVMILMTLGIVAFSVWI
jgi:hypothetical protein